METIIAEWAKPMLDAIKIVVPSVNTGLGGMASEGVEISKTDGDKLIDLFIQRGYEPYEQLDHYWVIESMHDGEVGITIDYREESIHSHGTGILNWFDENV